MRRQGVAVLPVADDATGCGDAAVCWSVEDDKEFLAAVAGDVVAAAKLDAQGLAEFRKNPHASHGVGRTSPASETHGAWLFTRPPPDSEPNRPERSCATRNFAPAGLRAPLKGGERAAAGRSERCCPT